MKKDGLYIVNTSGPNINLVQSKNKVVPFNIWHHQLGHASVDVISTMAHECLVGGLNTSEEAKLDVLCEDCIFRKHTTHPFRDKPKVEMTPLECVYIDLWGPASIESAGKAKYFMLIIDGATSY